ncbi:KH domain-containing protein [Candidatus Dojkabacteria bacterium]|uniref:KH domain-containing protein n=1 Tax=Candidatus Dojkabacteria bacterium TaxID=2099670 RepID=A0A955RIK5_9BACT|nr:KH domain-containing protein [Candidatus Dojkabacteria bacterium]
MDESKLIEQAKETASDFLTQMGLDADVTVTTKANDDEEKADYLQINLEGDNLGELVGYHGKNLEAIQIILGLFINKRIDDDKVRVLLDINDYKVGREKYLMSYAIQAAEQVRSSGQTMELEPMRPYERRIIHMALKEEEGIETDSIGEGNERRITIKSTADKLF